MKWQQNLLISHTLGNNNKRMEGNADVVDASAVLEGPGETSAPPVRTDLAAPFPEGDISQSLPAASNQGVCVYVARSGCVGARLCYT